jgi:hypothetical protein
MYKCALQSILYMRHIPDPGLHFVIIAILSRFYEVGYMYIISSVSHEQVQKYQQHMIRSYVISIRLSTNVSDRNGRITRTYYINKIRFNYNIYSSRLCTTCR